MLGQAGLKMRRFTIFVSVALAGCSSVSETAAEIQPQPSGPSLLAGINQGIADSHFAAPIEVTDPIRAPAISTPPWMVCIRSAASDETRRTGYTVFYTKGAYASSRYSVPNDRCGEQQFHPPPAPPPPPAPTPAKKHRR